MDVLWFNWKDIKNPEAGGSEVFTEVMKLGISRAMFPKVFENRINGQGTKHLLRGNMLQVIQIMLAANIVALLAGSILFSDR